MVRSDTCIGQWSCIFKAKTVRKLDQIVMSNCHVFLITAPSVASYVPNAVDALVLSSSLAVTTRSACVVYVHEDTFTYSSVLDSLSFEDAAPLADAGITPYHAIVDRAKVRLNETALLVGMGGLALTGLQILKAAGAKVIAVSRTQSKLELAKTFGADLVINTTSDDGVEAVKRFTDGYGVDHIFDFVGSGESIVRDGKYIRQSGEIILLGYQPGNQTVPVSTLRKFLYVGGSNNGTRKDLRDVVRLASEGKIKSIVTKAYSLDQVNEALNLLASGEVNGRLVLKF